MNKHAIPLPERFWSKVNVTDTGRCWNWRGATDKDGYGHILVDRRSCRSHKVALYLRTGKWPKYACHTCDNPSCCNPDHIYDGNHRSNMADKVTRGRCRTNAGLKHHMASLTREQILRIRTLANNGDLSISQIAAAVLAKWSAVQRVIAGTSYKEVK